MRDQNVVGTHSPRLVHGLMVVMVRRPARVADQIVNSTDDGRHCDPPSGDCDCCSCLWNHCLDTATRATSSGSMRCVWSSSPTSICTMSIRALNVVAPL